MPKRLIKAKYPLLFLLLFHGNLPGKGISLGAEIHYTNEMRKFVVQLSSKGKKEKPGFMVIAQNALETLTENGEAAGKPAMNYLAAIDGIGCEDLFYGMPKDGMITPKKITDFMLPFLMLASKMNKPVFIIDYTKGADQARSSRDRTYRLGFRSFQAERSLSMIPAILHDFNDNAIDSLKSAKNFLFLINGSRFRSIDNLIAALKKTDYDLLIIDLFFHGTPLTSRQVMSLKKKKNGKNRLVISYLSIGEAEDYRYYWKDKWKKEPPPFLEKENPEWRGNYKVRYWMGEWKEIIFGKDDGSLSRESYLKKILDAGFDGVYLDIIDAAQYFEEKSANK